MIRFRFLLLLGILLTVLIGCRSLSMVWSGNYSFPDTVWTAEDVIVFEPDTFSLEGKTPRNVVVSVRYGENLSVESLPVAIELESPKTGNFVTDTIDLPILPIGERTADKSRMGMFETCDTLPLKYKIMPGYRISIFHANPEVDVTGIYSLTFELE